MLTIDRRQWFRAAAAALAVGRTASAVDFDKPAPGSEKLTAQQSNGLILLRWNNRSLGTYRAHSSQKFPYFYPLAGRSPADPWLRSPRFRTRIIEASGSDANPSTAATTGRYFSQHWTDSVASALAG